MDGSTTTIEWYKEAGTIADDYAKRVIADGGTVEALDCLTDTLNSYNGYVDFCGTADPLQINWNGTRYSTTIPTSASIRLLIETPEQRSFLNPIFNGGWVVSIKKDGQPYWMGKLIPTLSIEEYKIYPYALTLNANDSIAKTNDRQMLMIDFPEPWPAKVTMIEFIIKTINRNFYPNDIFRLNISMNLYFGVPNDRVFENTYIDPLVFMDSEKAEYISNKKVLDSFLGVFGLQLFQWKAEWYIVSTVAQWDAGNIKLSSYSITGDTWEYLGNQTINLGILDLYSCDFDTAVQIGSSANIGFLSPWREVTLSQSFQMNTNILPAFANRPGNFYQGDSGIILEMWPTPITDRLRHWTTEGLIATTYYNIENQGSVSVPVVFPETRTEEKAYVSKVIDPAIRFSRFIFAVNSIQTYDKEPLSGDNIKNAKRVLKIKFTDTSNNVFYFWDNKGSFFDWSSERHQITFDQEDINLEGNMPNNHYFDGGTFTITIYNAVIDETDHHRYGMLYSGLQLGIVSAAFKVLPAKAEAKFTINRLQHKINASIGRDPTLTSTTEGFAIEYGKFLKNRTQERRKLAQAGGVKQGRYSTQTIVWEDDIEVSINPNADVTNKYEYVYGLSLPSVDSYHDIHLSSPYDIGGDAVDSWFNEADDGQELDLMTWRARAFLNDNTEYTTQLTGKWRGAAISPLQLVNDYEGRLYSFTKGTWIDKDSVWSNVYTEFKAARNIPDQPVKCDYSPYDYNDDYCKVIPGYYEKQLFFLEPGAIDVNAGYTAAGIGALRPAIYNGLEVFDMMSFGENWFRLNLGAAGGELLNDAASVTVYFPDPLDIGATLTPQSGYSYGGNIPGIQAILNGSIGVEGPVFLTANKI